MCGKTVSPFPHAHFTSRLIHPHVGGRRPYKPILPFLDILTQDGVLLLMHRFWHFTHTQSWESNLMCTILLCVWILWLGDFAVCISLRCGSDRVNSPPCGLFLLPHVAEKSIVVGSSMNFGLLWVHLRFWVDVGSYWVVLATIGPRTTQESFSFPKLWIACVTACMQWLVFGLCWG